MKKGSWADTLVLRLFYIANKIHIMVVLKTNKFVLISAHQD